MSSDFEQIKAVFYLPFSANFALNYTASSKNRKSCIYVVFLRGKKLKILCGG